MRRIVRMPLLAAVLATAVAASIPAGAEEPGNAEAGEDVYKKCRACHDVGPGAQNKVGPPLTGIIGRPVGMFKDYTYSDANKALGAKGAVWTEDELLKYLEDPLTYLPKTKMAFAGLKDKQDRLDLIAYLKTFK